MSLTYVPVVGTFTYRDADATPAYGEKIHFVAVSDAIVDGAVVTLPRKLVATLNSDGEIPDTFTLPTVGDGVYYSVREKFPGGRADYTIQVLTTDTEIDLATVAPVVPVDPLVSYATTAQLAAAVAASATAAQGALADTAVQPAGLTAAAVASALTTEATSARVYAAGDAGKYTRHTATGAKTATFNTAASLPVSSEYHVANRAASGNLTLNGTMTLNPQKNGTLVLEPGDTVTVKVVSSSEADVIGSSVAA